MPSPKFARFVVPVKNQAALARAMKRYLDGDDLIERHRLNARRKQ